MRQVFIKREGNPRLLLFFAGWGSDEHLFTRPVMEGYDYLLCFDYSCLDFDYSLLEGYREIRLMAWSMGVWAASQVLQGRDYPWQLRLAVNGTPVPVDDERGIPEAIFQGTLANFSEPVLVRFRRRICGTAEGVKEFLSYAPYRSVESLQEELAALYHEVKERPVAPFGWDIAYVGTRDKIFPPAAQCRAWEQRAAVVTVEAEHYDAGVFNRLLIGEEELWTKR